MRSGGMAVLAIAYYRAGATTAGPSVATPHAIVAVTTNNGVVYGLRADNGHQLWEFTAPKVQQGNSTGIATIVQEQVVYALLGSQVSALRAIDGTIAWHATRSDSPLLTVHAGIAYVVTGDKTTSSLDLQALPGKNGTQLWHYQTEAISAVADDTTVYIYSAAPHSGWNQKVERAADTHRSECAKWPSSLVRVNRRERRCPADPGSGQGVSGTGRE